MHTKRRNNQRGYTTIVLAASLFVIIGAAGLAIDVGRIYSAKSDVQNFVDSASIDATMQLDGTSAGIANAQAAVTYTQSLFKWDFATKTIPTSKIVVSFARGMIDAPNIPDPSTWPPLPSIPPIIVSPKSMRLCPYRFPLWALLGIIPRAPAVGSWAATISPTTTGAAPFWRLDYPSTEPSG